MQATRPRLKQRKITTKIKADYTLEMYAIEKQLKTLSGIMDETMELAASSTGDGKRFQEEIKSLSSQMVVLSARLYGVNLSL